MEDLRTRLLDPENPVMQDWLRIQQETGQLMGAYARVYQQELEHRVNHDDLVPDLLNRSGLHQWFEKSRPEVFMIVLLDGISFGEINKRFGQKVGDDVLQDVGPYIANKFRTEEESSYQAENRKNPGAKDMVALLESPEDVAVARLGGDEFMVVVDFSGLSQGEVQTARIAVEEKLNDLDKIRCGKHNEVEVSLRHASVIGRASDNLGFDHYYDVASKRLVQVTKDEKALAA